VDIQNSRRRTAAAARAARRPRLRLAAAAALTAALALLSACSSSSAPKTATLTPAPGATAASSPGTPVDGAEIDQLPTAPSPTATPTAPDLSTVAGQTAFLEQVFADVQATWSKEFAASKLTYSPARLVLFRSQVSTACGTESAEVGPFYCSGDRVVYLDIQFFQSLAARFHVTGDFAEAYVVAHEVGHHVQNLLGISSRVGAASQASPSAANALSVKAELQADCFAGVWAHSTYERKLLEPGDIEEALKAAQAVGDDYLARAANTAVDPDSWTHGSSAQRQQWFTTGYKDGKPEACDTFAG
jgi:predicted metalloprotease